MKVLKKETLLDHWLLVGEMARDKRLICSSVNLLRFIRPSPRWDGLYLKPVTFAGNRSAIVMLAICYRIDGINPTLSPTPKAAPATNPSPEM